MRTSVNMYYTLIMNWLHNLLITIRGSNNIEMSILLKKLEHNPPIFYALSYQFHKHKRIEKEWYDMLNVAGIQMNITVQMQYPSFKCTNICFGVLVY